MIRKKTYDNLTYEKFRKLAKRKDLSIHEKVGFPNDYREGLEEHIFADMLKKVRSLDRENCTALEIGPGCSALPVMLADLCAKKQSTVHFVDSREMLKLLPNGGHIHKWPGCYPEVPNLIKTLEGKVDCIIAYSVIQYVFAESNLWKFIDQSLMMLKNGGEMFLGDIPNITMRKRFFSSKDGVKMHKKFTCRGKSPTVKYNQIEIGKIDDSVVLGIIARVRSEGYHAWLMPQGNALPMANRREDILIRKP